MDENKSLQIINNSPTTPIPPTDPMVSATPMSHIPLPKEKPKKSFLKKPLFWITVTILFLFAGGYYYVYSSLDAQLSRISARPALIYPSPTPSVTKTQTLTYIYPDHSFSFQYPSTYIIASDSAIIDDVITLSKAPIQSYDQPLGYEKTTLRKDMDELASGQFGETLDFALPISKKIFPLGKSYGKAFLVLGRFDVCSVTTEGYILFYLHDDLIKIRVSGNPTRIMQEMPGYFTIDKENCGTRKVWQMGVQDYFYVALQQRKGGKAAQEWFDTYNQILSTLKVTE